MVSELEESCRAKGGGKGAERGEGEKEYLNIPSLCPSGDGHPPTGDDHGQLYAVKNRVFELESEVATPPLSCVHVHSWAHCTLHMYMYMHMPVHFTCTHTYTCTCTYLHVYLTHMYCTVQIPFSSPPPLSLSLSLSL